MKQEYKRGWFKVKAVFEGRKYEITVFDGVNFYCEDVKVSSYAEARNYCHGKINAA